jgi:hypothetical protein
MRARKATHRPKVQTARQAYLYVCDVERKLRKTMDEIPYSILRSKKTRDQLRAAAADLHLAVGRLKAVRKEWLPIYNRSAAATTVEARP